MKFEIFPTEAEIIAIHEDQIAEYGGEPGFLNRSMIDSAIGRLRNGYYNDAIEGAAAFMESLANNHAFVDGNKRVAYYGGDAFLGMYGYQIVCDEVEAAHAMIDLIAKGRFKQAHIDQWLRGIVKPI